MNCTQLATAETKAQHQLDNASAKQTRAQNGDVAGVFFLLLPLASISGNDNEANVAINKGIVQAIQSVRTAKRCP